MSDLFHFNSQQWKLWSCDGLKLFLPRIHRDRSIYFQADWFFYPPGMDELKVRAETPKLHVRIIGHVPDLRDWRDLEKVRLGFFDEVDDENAPELRGPDVWFFQPGETSDPRCSEWLTQMAFGERNGNEFEFSLEGLRRSERASNFLLDNHLKQFFNQPVTPDWELPEWINEGDQFSFEGRLQLKEIFCSVPINCAQSVEWARQLSRRELAVEEFGACHICDNSGGKYKFEEGIQNTGRLVVLELPA